MQVYIINDLGLIKEWTRMIDDTLSNSNLCMIMMIYHLEVHCFSLERQQQLTIHDPIMATSTKSKQKPISEYLVTSKAVVMKQLI